MYSSLFQQIAVFSR